MRYYLIKCSVGVYNKLIKMYPHKTLIQSLDAFQRDILNVHISMEHTVMQIDLGILKWGQNVS